MLEIQAFSKLIDYVAAGIGAVAGPLLAPWAARRHAKAAVIEAQGKADARAILAASEAHQLQTIAQAQLEARRLVAPPALTSSAERTDLDLVTEAWQFQRDKRMHNMLAVAEAAAAELGDETVPGDGPDPDLDWAARFFSSVQDVSSAEMQELWARLLAGEVRRPGSTSIRTLEILRNLDRRVAEAFQRLCALSTAIVAPADFVRHASDFGDLSFSGGRGWAVHDQRVISVGGSAAQNSLQPYGLSYPVLNVLNEYGLITAEYDSQIDYRAVVVPARESWHGLTRIVHARRHWILSRDSGDLAQESLLERGVALSSAGTELASVVDFEANDQYLTELREYFQRQGLRLVEVET